MNWIEKQKNNKVLGEVTCEVVTNEHKKKIGKMSIRGFIGSGMFEDGVTDGKVEKILNEMDGVDEVEVVINSGGGDVFTAFGIFSQLKKFPAKIVTIIEGVAASAAAFLAEAGDERSMSANALFMIHKASGGGFGNQTAIAKLLDVLKKVDGILENTFVNASTSTLEEIQGFMDAEEFMTAEQAKDRGLIDNIDADSDVTPHVTEQKDSDAEDAVKSIIEKLEKDFKDSKPFREKYHKLVEQISAGIPSKPANKKPTKTEEAEMVATEMLTKIQNALKIEDSDKLLESIEGLQDELSKEKKVTASMLTNKVNDKDSVDDGMSVRLVAVEKKQVELEKENKSLKDQRDLAVGQMEGVITFKNDEILKQRRNEIQALFDSPVCKINPAVLKDGLETFVDIKPDQVEGTQVLYDHSIRIWNMNASDAERLAKLNGSNEVDDKTDPDKAKKDESAESISNKIEVHVLAYKEANKCSYEAAVKAVEISHSDLHQAYEDAMAK